MTFDDHISKAAGFFQLRMFDAAWSQREEINPEEPTHHQVLGLRLGILKGLKKWEMGSAIACGAVKAFPESTMLYVMGAIHIRHHENVQNALEFFLAG